MLDDRYDARSDAVMEAAFELGRRLGNVEPLHLVVALSEDDGAAAQLLRPGDAPGGLRAAVFGASEIAHDSVWWGYRTRQILGSAQQWADSHDALVSPEHLLVALVKQADADVVAACAANRVDLGAARERALTELGWSNANVPPLEPLEPAGTMDRPPLPVSDLPSDVWAELEARQRRLPLARVRRTWQWHALFSNELRTARRIVTKAAITEDERYSLLHHHHKAIERLAADAIPELSARPQGPSSGLFTINLNSSRRRRLMPEGWVCWLGNRRVGMRNAWFRLTWRY